MRLVFVGAWLPVRAGVYHMFEFDLADRDGGLPNLDCDSDSKHARLGLDLRRAGHGLGQGGLVASQAKDNAIVISSSTTQLAVTIYGETLIIEHTTLNNVIMATILPCTKPSTSAYTL